MTTAEDLRTCLSTYLELDAAAAVAYDAFHVLDTDLKERKRQFLAVVSDETITIDGKAKAAFSSEAKRDAEVQRRLEMTWADVLEAHAEAEQAKRETAAAAARAYEELKTLRALLHHETAVIECETAVLRATGAPEGVTPQRLALAIEEASDPSLPW